MLSPMASAIILCVSGLLLLVGIPLLDGSKRFGKYISLRYTLVVVSLLMALGCVLNFTHLIESSRNIVLLGGLVLTGLFVIVRSAEKIKLGSRTVHLTAKKGDIELGASIEKEKENNNGEEKKD